MFRKLSKDGRGHRISGPQGFEGLISWLGLGVGLWSLTLAALALYFPFQDSPVGTALLTVAPLAALLGTSIFVVQAVGVWRTARLRVGSRREYEYKQLVGDSKYVEDVVACGNQAIGTAHPDADLVRRRLDENPEALRVCVREWDNGRLKFCGYVLLYSLREEVARRIIAGSVRSEAEFGPDPLTPTIAEASYLYVGMLLGTDRHAVPHVKDRLRLELIGILSSGRVKRVFARRGSKGGHKVMKEYGFQPIGPKDGVWSIAGSDLLERLRSGQTI